MAILDILNYPDARLYKVAKPVSKVDEKIQRLIDDMAETMYEAPGIGLAATQVDVQLRAPNECGAARTGRGASQR